MISFEELFPKNYEVIDNGLYLIKHRRDYEEQILICNFVPYIVSEIICDDGLEPTRRYEAEGIDKHGELLPRIVISEKEFANMDWVRNKWGLVCNIAPDSSAVKRLRYATMTIQLHDCIDTKYMYNQRTHTETGTSTNNWRDSDIRLWLNTDDVISGYSANNGFLDKLDPDLLAVVGYCAKSTLRNSASGGDGGKAVKTIERFFLPSRTEVFARTESTITDNTIPESAIIKSEDTTVNTDKKYYVADASNVLTVAVPTGTENPKTLGWYEIKAEYEFYGAERSDYNVPSEAADANRKKRVGTGFSDWWLRSPSTSNTNYARYVRNDGNVSYSYGVTISFGVAPACVII